MLLGYVEVVWISHTSQFPNEVFPSTNGLTMKLIDQFNN